jgi:hypothetical protein
VEIADKLGKRVERILFFGVFVTIASLSLMIVCIGLGSRSQIKLAHAYEAFAEKIDAEHDQLQEKWEQASKEKIDYRSTYDWSMYDLSYQTIALKYYLTPERFVDFVVEFNSYINTIGKKEPQEISTDLRSKAKEILQTPASAYGISIPVLVDMPIGNSHVTSNLESIALISRIALAPVIILWLGNYLGTRYRELVVIAHTQSIMNIYPHLLNSFGTVDDLIVRKSNAKSNRLFQTSIPTLARIIMIIIMIFPSVIAYIISIFTFGGDEGYFLIPLTLIVTQTLATVLIEAIGEAGKKVFITRGASSR